MCICIDLNASIFFVFMFKKKKINKSKYNDFKKITFFEERAPLHHEKQNKKMKLYYIARVRRGR